MNWLAVALGGSLGAMCRYALAITLPHAPGRFPLATFTVNVVGSFLMAAAFVWIVEKSALPLIWRQIAMVGFLGAFTTFSTFSMESLQLLHTGHVKLAVVYMFSSVGACVMAAALSYTLFNKLM